MSRKNESFNSIFVKNQVMKNLLSLATIVLFLSSCGAQSSANKTKTTASETSNESQQICERIDAEKFKNGIASGNVQVLDVRTPDEFSQGKIEGAVNINFYDSDFKAQVANKLDKKVPVYLYCRSGGRSQQALQILKELGFSKVYELSGGYMNY